MSEWQETYAARLPLFQRLEEEVLFSLKAEIAKAGIKLHSLTARVKTLDSLTEKAERKQWEDPLTEAGDIVGVRVVVLFTSDLPKVQSIVTSVFDVFSTEDKVEGSDDPSTFGYMSMHYGATISSAHIGPRYEGLREMPFEVQTRTILMDAWANVSHHLAYKDESSIPQELRKDFHALSGLFYVADKHFELFFARSREVEHQATEALGRPSNTTVELNLETLAAFLRQRYPKRVHSSRDVVAELVTDLHHFRIRDLSALEVMLDSVVERAVAKEKQTIGTRKLRYWFTDVGFTRLSLGIDNPRYASYRIRRRARRATAAGG